MVHDRNRAKGVAAEASGATGRTLARDESVMPSGSEPESIRHLGR